MVRGEEDTNGARIAHHGRADLKEVYPNRRGGCPRPVGAEEVQLRFFNPIVFAALRLTPLGLPRPFDPVEWVGFSALTVELVIEGLCWKVKVRHHEPGIGALAAKLQPGDEGPFFYSRSRRRSGIHEYSAA